MNGQSVLGFIPARRGFFSAELAAMMRDQTVEAMQATGIQTVVPGKDQTQLGCVESIAEAEFCADLFRRRQVQGILINAVNFGDEQAAAWVVRKAKLDVPILIVGCQEQRTLSLDTDRRDSFCGLLSIGDALRQIGARYSVARRPICFPTDDSFTQDLRWFAAVCRVVNGLRDARYGQIGTRPEPFWTCRYDERMMQRMGACVVVADLSDVIGELAKIPDDDPQVRAILTQMNDYADTSALTNLALVKIAKFETYLKRFIAQHNLNGLAIQCWTSIQHHFGICTCTTMSRLGDTGMPCACEADILGTMSMHACQLASGLPAALADWNNLHNEDDELVNLWHCGVLPRSFARGTVKLGTHGILVPSGATRAQDSQGVAECVAKPSPLTLARIAQDQGRWKALVAQGDIEDNQAQTFGAYGWCRIEHLQRLYRDVLLRHFPHHVAMTQTHVGDVLWEALGNYLEFEVYHATQPTPGLYTSRLPFNDHATRR